MRLIDAELAQKNIARHLVQVLHVGNEKVDELMSVYNPSSVSTGIDYGMNLAEEIIRKQPTVEAKPVVRGEWIDVENSRGGHECSICKTYAPSYVSGRENLSNFCPNCGCDMRGEKHD